MDIIILPDSKKLIPNHTFNTCLVDNLSLEEICKLYTFKDLGKNGCCYRIDKFIYHLKTKHNISVQEYFIKYHDFDWPKCPIKGNLVGFKIWGKGMVLSRFNKGGVSKEHCPAFAKACEKFAEERKGAGNPMYGLEAWNSGLTNETDERIRLSSGKRLGRKASEETKNLQSKRRMEHPLKIRHGIPHSKETVEKMRVNTAKLWATGVFNRTTSIHIKMREFLKTLNLKYEWVEEFQVKYFSMDFAFPNVKIAIECQGTYYHIDPRIYPNGPKDAIQRRNFGRDIAKRKVCCDQQGWTIIEVWETEFNDGTFKEQLLCRLKELNLLNN